MEFHPELGIKNHKPKKVSGRWGHRPLGRGGWRVFVIRRSSALPAALPRSRAANRTQEIARTPMGLTASDYYFILLSGAFFVDRPRVSFAPVLSRATEVLGGSTEVLCTAQRSSNLVDDFRKQFGQLAQALLLRLPKRCQGIGQRFHAALPPLPNDLRTLRGGH